MRTLILLVATLVCAGCSGNATPSTRPSTKPTKPVAAAKPARLVVTIVYDQFPAWALQRYRALLSPDGALRRTAARGAEHIVEYSHAGTYTAAGHAAIFTGSPPADSGVPANKVWSAKRGKRPVVDDGVHPSFGASGEYVSPSVLRVDTVADALRKAHGDKARIVSVSIKDRAAVMGGGKKPDISLWYSKKLGAITTSSYYARSLPAWVDAWRRKNPISDRYKDWTPTDAAKLEALLGADEAAGEGDYLGFGVSFPHNPITTRDPRDTVRLMPQSTDYLLDLARTAVVEYRLGEDDIPDLLAISVSSLDYVGHTFGPESWEYVDNLIRIDAAVGALLAELEKRTSIAVLITSDHGGAPIPERSTRRHPTAGRLYPDELPVALNAAVEKVLGPGNWVAAYVQPFIYLHPAARMPDKRARAVAAVIGALGKLPVVHSAHDVRKAARWRTDRDEVKRAIALAIPGGDLGDVFVVPAKGSIVDDDSPRGKGSSHGTPWDYDRQVPAVFSAPGMKPSRSTQPLDQARVAATISALLRVPAPAQIRNIQALPGL